jgi:LytR cell envelope-related transcriptional attenuator
MVDLLERIGPYLGIAAFLGLAILAFLIIQQAREVRRLREWAGRAPERADEAAQAAAAAAEARGDAAEHAPREEEEEAEPAAVAPEAGGQGRFARLRDAVAAWFARLRDAVAAWFAALDRRLPMDPRYLIAVLAAVLIAAGVLTSGFGLIGDDGGGAGDGQRGGEKPKRVEVAVLNATQVDEGSVPIEAVAGLAAKVGDEVIKPAKGFKVGREETAASGFEATTIMFEPNAEAEAEDLARTVSDQLGETPVTPMVDEVRQLSGNAPLALVIGQDDAEF